MESLLAFAQEESALEHPAWKIDASLPEASAAFSVGTLLGPYKIDGKIGEGGMGEVYRAADTRLGRAVAIKTCRREFSERFQREARTIASLNHPHICSLYDVGPNYLVMELLDGETLAAKVKQATVSIEQSLLWCRQIADALLAAHSKGIVHRDIKPANVMITSNGSVKVLDFGLAKRTNAASTGGSTITAGLTEVGTALGTPAYMAPEQAQGKEVDKRADVWAFGVLLYELLTGRHPFPGDSMQATFAAVLAKEPDLSVVPARVRPLLRACLKKDPRERLSNIGDWQLLLAEDEQTLSAAPKQPGPGRWITWSAMGLLGLLLLGAAALWLRQGSAGSGGKASDGRTIRFLIPLPQKAAFGTYDQPVLSPDGKRIVFSARNEKPGFFVHSLETLETRYFPGPEEFVSPFWSPDGRFIAFLSNGSLKKVDLLSGSVTTICEAALGFGGAWNQDDAILFGSNQGLMRVSAAGGKPARVTVVDGGKGELFHSWPSFLPDRDHFLFSVAAARADSRGAYIGSLSSGPPRRILPDATNAQYNPLGYVIFNRDRTLLAQRFDVAHLLLTADPFVIAQGVAGLSNFYFAAFSTAGDSLVYRTDSGLSVTRMEWRDREGKVVGTVGAPADYSNPALSPDGRSLAVSKRDPATRTRDIWLFDLARGTDRRLTFDPADDTAPAWSADGQRVVFSSNRKGHRDLWQKAASGARDEEPVLVSNDERSLDDWTHDGRYLIFGNHASGINREEWALPLFGDRKPFAVIRGPATIQGAEVSANGKWIAYASDESGRQEIYVENFPPAGGKWQISTDGGIEPSWSLNGKELFYLHLNRLMAVDVKTGTDRFDQGTPHVLFDAPFGNMMRNAYATSPDGQRFLVNARIESTDTLPMTVILNWTAAARR